MRKTGPLMCHKRYACGHILCVQERAVKSDSSGELLPQIPLTPSMRCAPLPPRQRGSLRMRL